MVSIIKNIIEQLFAEKHRTAIVDPRTPVEQAKDYLYGKDITLDTGSTSLGQRLTAPPFEPYNQQATSACGAYSGSHIRKLNESVENFPLVWYRARSNYSGEGMYTKEAIEFAAKANTFPIPGYLPYLTEGFANSMNSLSIIDLDRKTNVDYFQIAPYDADAVFTAVDNGYATIVGIYCTLNEWAEEMYARDFTTISLAPVHHFLAAIPNSHHMKDGYEWISVLESAQYGGWKMRHIRKDFLEKRMFLGGGFYHKPENTPAIPATHERVKPNGYCQYGQKNDAVLTLQNFLRDTGFLDAKYTTSYYGPRTSKAVLDWQLKNIVDIDKYTLNSYGGKYWGPVSVKRVNELYI
jgi:hypothetical protein